jgi:hypothetical protein
MCQAAHWLEFVEEYDFSIEHHAGTAHGNCEALSRRPCTTDSTAAEKQSYC